MKSEFIALVQLKVCGLAECSTPAPSMPSNRRRSSLVSACSPTVYRGGIGEDLAENSPSPKSANGSAATIPRTV